MLINHVHLFSMLTHLPTQVSSAEHADLTVSPADAILSRHEDT
jgi:hypothetical protein